MIGKMVLMSALMLAGPISVSAAKPDFADFDRRAQNGENLTVVFFGCSLTWGANATDPNQTSYRALVAKRLEEKYPKAHFRFHDSAIGGTASQLGLFRVNRDVLRHKPDLVFVDFSANDGLENATPELMASYEAIIRRIITESSAPVVQMIFPFKWHIEQNGPDKLMRRMAHRDLSKTYNTGLGDAVALIFERIKAKQITIQDIWSVDGVHPADAGYVVFADAAWNGYLDAVKAKRVCTIPEKMVYADTYMTSARVMVSSLAPLPAGWKQEKPQVSSRFHDMLMSRWLDDLTVAHYKPASTNARANTAASVKVEPLEVRFRGSMVMLFGESTLQSCKYRVVVDGKEVSRPGSKAGSADEKVFDSASLANMCGGTVHLSPVLVSGLDPKVDHTMKIIPDMPEDQEQELRLESICIAGGEAKILPAASAK